MLGFFCGIARFARHENDFLKISLSDEEIMRAKKTRILRAVDVILTSSFVCIISYLLLSYFTTLEYTFKVGVAGSIALYGVDKILEWAEKIKGVKNG